MDRPVFETKLLAIAETWVGSPFRHNGRSRSQGVDCLGLIVCVLREAGLPVPDGDGQVYRADWYLHTPEDRYLSGLLAYGVRVDREDLRIGDVCFFKTGLLSRSKIDMVIHGGLYVGGDRMLHACNGRPVGTANLNHRAWRSTYAGAIRLTAVLSLLGETL